MSSISSNSSIVDVRGNTITLDPRSKIISTLVLVLGIAISIDYFQIFIYVLFIPLILLLFRPRTEFIRRIPVTLPFIIFIAIAFFIGIGQNPVRISVLGYEREYTRFGFVGLIVYRYLISVIYTYILIYSEDSHVDIIEALSSFKISRPFKSILMLINRLSTRLMEDYEKMILAAKSKGKLLKAGPSELMFKLRILARILSRTTSLSVSISNTLVARGFMGDFASKTRGWNSEGMTVTVLSIIFAGIITAIPWMRV